MTKLHVVINAVNDNVDPRGPDRYLLELIPEILRADTKIRLTTVVAPWQVALTQNLRQHGATLFVTQPPRRPAPRLIWQATRFPALARSLEPDLVFLPNLIWAPSPGAPTILTAHDLLHFRSPEKFGHLKTALLKPVIRKALASADRVIAVSDFTAGDCRRFADVPDTRLRVVTEGGPPPLPRSQTQADKRFLYVGKIERSKGITTLVESFANSPLLHNLGYRLQIVGPEGNATTDVQAAIARSNAPIDLLGFVDADRLRGLYHRCRGFVFPSTAEGFGLVLLEAMAHGAPVITTRATSLPEVAGDAALLVDPDDPQQLLRAMERLGTDDAVFRDLQSRGYARLNAFSWETAGRETARIFREVAQ